MKCDRQLLSFYRDGQLSLEQRYEVDCHLVACQTCTSDLRGLMRMAQVIRSMPLVPVDPELGRSVRRLIADREPARRGGQTFGGLVRGFAPAVVAASVAVSLIVTFRPGALETSTPAPVVAPAANSAGPAVAPPAEVASTEQSASPSRNASRPVAAPPGNRLVSLPGASGSTEAAAVPAPIGRFYSSHQDVRDLLGEAQPGSRTVTLLEQSFQGGLAIWRSDTREIYVLRRDGNTWSAHADTWQPGDPTSVDVPPPPGAMVPAGGFGTVWRTTPEVQKRLGWAVYEPRGSGGSIQTFERGMVVWTPHGLIYVLTNDGRWRTYADATPM